jgi:hypothetical protein
MTKGLGDEIYSGAASFGKLRAIIGVIFGTIISIGLIIGGILAIIHKIKFTSKTTGISIDSKGQPVPVNTCSSNNDKDNNITYQCNFKVEYTIGSDKYYKTFNTSKNTNYSGQTNIVIYYDKKDPSNVALDQDDYHIIGYFLLGIGIFTLLASWIGLWIVYKYKFAAAASGAAGAIQMVKMI